MQYILNLVFILSVLAMAYIGSVFLQDYKNLKASMEQFVKLIEIQKDSLEALTENEQINIGKDEIRDKNINALKTNQEIFVQAFNNILEANKSE